MWASTKPRRLGSGRKRRGNDTAGLAKREEGFPVVWSNDTATVGSKDTRLEVKRAKKVAARVR